MYSITSLAFILPTIMILFLSLSRHSIDETPLPTSVAEKRKKELVIIQGYIHQCDVIYSTEDLRYVDQDILVYYADFAGVLRTFARKFSSR